MLTHRLKRNVPVYVAQLKRNFNNATLTQEAINALLASGRGNLLTENIDRSNAKIKTIVIHPEFASLSKIDFPGVYPEKNENTTVFFENEFILDKVKSGLDNDFDLHGFISWRFFTKIGLSTYQNLYNQLRVNEKADCFSFFGKHRNYKVWALANTWHPGILHIAEKLLPQLNIKERPERIVAPYIVYQNAVFTSKEIWEDYVKHFLEPAMKIMQEDKDIAQMCNAWSGYRPDYMNKQFEVYLKEKTGYEYFTMHAFVCERLWSTYLYYNKHLKLKQLW